MTDSWKTRLDKLLSVKSIVTVVLTGVFAYLSISGVDSKDFNTVYLMVITFYFGTQSNKN